jgi:hypothetical protein
MVSSLRAILLWRSLDDQWRPYSKSNKKKITLWQLQKQTLLQFGLECYDLLSIDVNCFVKDGEHILGQPGKSRLHQIQL